MAGDKPFRFSVLTKATAATTAHAQENKPKFDVLVVTPMRLVRLIEEKAVDLSHVKHLVLDEGDQLLEMGFVDQVFSLSLSLLVSKTLRALVGR